MFFSLGLEVFGIGQHLDKVSSLFPRIAGSAHTGNMIQLSWPFIAYVLLLVIMTMVNLYGDIKMDCMASASFASDSTLA